jgi:hypothetical protein
VFNVDITFYRRELKMKAINLRNVIIAVLIIGIGNGFAQAGRQEILAMLSTKEAEFEFEDVTITEALNKIGQVAGGEIVLSDEAQWKLPQSQTTRMSALLEGSLAECLTEMLNAFFMRYAVSDDKITIYPRKELEHILGRPSNKQLKLLKNLYSIKISYNGNYSDEQIKVLIGEVLDDVSFLPYDVPQRISEIIERNSTDKGIAAISLAVLLEQVCDFGKWSTWYISGMDFPNQSPLIKLVDAKEYREAVLDQIVDISFEGRRADRADVILQRLAGWTGMDLLIIRKEPSSWLEEKISVNMQNIKLKQALINIVDSVGGQIEIDISENSIRIYAPVHPRKKESVAKLKNAGSSGEGYVGKISIPIGQGVHQYFIEFMLREKDLTEELKQLREEKIKQILEKFSKIDIDKEAVKVTFHPQSYTVLN